MSKFALGMFSFLIALLVCLVGVVVFAGAGLLDTQETPFSEAVVLDTMAMTNASVALQEHAVSDTLSSEDLAVVTAGDALFKNNCAQCHAVNDVVVGPALKDITKRRPLSWLLPWVKNSSKVVASGDEYAVKLFNQYQKQQMPSFQLSDAEVKNIVKYLEVESGKTSSFATAGVIAN
ncbi:cytochrome c [Hymenobacter sp. GOD-10R]|uniref:cytochrome c n=1 Tax=Hymenobacter sp. GOD-10R TaxID=3093922 RepID=UPI002D7A2864|nr:cytochrome c [Hymenobacter sp. GOD-10R]WRQ26941.1 cytochrome c [Hymenobacter sp. GOD-10R]